VIDPKAITTYAQYKEDIVLLALLYDVKNGFYVDVGANYPTADSVTKLFYEKGWRGINIEPIESLYQQLQKERPEDINLHCGAGAETGRATLREYPRIPGHSTFNESLKVAADKDLKFREYEVEIIPLADIFKAHKIKHIHFLKIDVEGYEYDVVEGNDWSEFRPEVVCIEANHLFKNWRPIITKNKYKLFITDGLNEYYVADEAWQRTKNYAERAVKLDNRALKRHQKEDWEQDSQHLKSLSEQLKTERLENESLQAQLKRVASLSLIDQPLSRRIKRSLYGLSVDWYRYRKSNKNH
jgi:FkbM family methyltransferase